MYDTVIPIRDVRTLRKNLFRGFLPVKYLSIFILYGCLRIGFAVKDKSSPRIFVEGFGPD